ncbi:hypothetical protein LY76DRAFT_587267 [Colletotrichum caudatum]|nr:hypothetical protein LY76DRAFT_587267 [Colletotrichum caudatum]
MSSLRLSIPLPSVFFSAPNSSDATQNMLESNVWLRGYHTADQSYHHSYLVGISLPPELVLRIHPAAIASAGTK